MVLVAAASYVRVLQNAYGGAADEIRSFKHHALYDRIPLTQGIAQCGLGRSERVAATEFTKKPLPFSFDELLYLIGARLLRDVSPVTDANRDHKVSVRIGTVHQAFQHVIDSDVSGRAEQHPFPLLRQLKDQLADGRSLTRAGRSLQKSEIRCAQCQFHEPTLLVGAGAADVG